jgi:hypothetical protein
VGSSNFSCLVGGKNYIKVVLMEGMEINLYCLGFDNQLLSFKE